MTTEHTTALAPDTERPTGTPAARAGAGRSGEPQPLPVALHRAAELRRARAVALRDWSREVRPVLARSLCRRAAELELAAVALELRADGLEGGVAEASSRQEEGR